MIKHSENLEGKDKVKFDLYKILRMSVLLGKDQVDELTLNKFKEASLNIDNMLNKEYYDKLDSMFYSTSSLEEEEKRLKELVAFIKDRIEQRKSLQEDYRTVTSKPLEDLEYIEKSSELDLYERRLQIIKNYLDNSKLIENNEKDLEILRAELAKEYNVKRDNEEKNIKIEEELYNAFINVLYEMDLYSKIELANIDDELSNIQKELNEAKEQKDTFVTAFNNLKSSGISGELELEYSSYVENSKRNYYYVKEREIILKLYKLIASKEAEYSNLFAKREEIKSLLQEKTILRNELGIRDKDYLSTISDLIFDQRQEIELEKNNVDNINVLTERIKLKENRLEELKKEIKKPEVLSILKEYSLIDTYDHDDILDDTIEVGEEEEEISLAEEPEESSVNLLDDLLEEEVPEVVKTYEDNEIKSVEDVPSMNFGLSRLKSISVMKRVADMLGVNEKQEPIATETPKEEKVEEMVHADNNEDLFWTPAEILDINKDMEKVSDESQDLSKDEIFLNDSSTQTNSNIFETNNGDGQIIFPEPVMPEIGKKNLPENKEDKFMWPDNMETFDLNGIFPN